MRVRFIVCATVAALALTASLDARADGVLPAAATPVQREQAQARFMRGRELMAKKRYDQALTEFRASHDIVTSPNTRLEIARCLRAMGRPVAAYAELGRTAVEAKELVHQDNRYQRTYDAATAERAEIEPQLGFVSLKIGNATDGTKVSIAGEELRRAAWDEPAPVAAGKANVVVETPGHQPVTKTVTLAAGQRTSLAIDAQSGQPEGSAGTTPAAATEAATATAPEPQKTHRHVPLRTWAYVAGGVGVAGLATFTIAGLMAQSTYNDLNNVCKNGPCPANKTDEINSGKTQQTIANVGLVVGIAGVAAGATLFVLSMPKRTPASNAALVVGPSWMGVRGSF